MLKHCAMTRTISFMNEKLDNNPGRVVTTLWTELLFVYSLHCTARSTPPMKETG